MTVQPVIQSGGSARGALLLATLLPAAMFLLAACSSSNPAPGVPTSQAATKSMTPPDPDPRVGLRAGKTDAAIASWNMQLIATRQSPPGADEAWNSDLAFLGNYILQGNFNGFVVWDAANRATRRW